MNKYCTFSHMLLLIFIFDCTLAIAAPVRYYQFELLSNNLKEYNQFLDGRDPATITEFNSPYFKRHPMEMFIFQTALKLGGCECEIKYTTYEMVTPHARAINLIKDGQLLSHPIASSLRDSRIRNMYLSIPILENDEFEVGLFTHHKRQDILSITNVDQAHKLRFAVSRNWEIDRKVLERYRLKTVLADYWVSIMKMIMAGRADVILQPFTNRSDLGFIDGDLNELFVPIPNMKINFGNGRGYMVSKKHPHGEQFLQWLNKGILKLKQNGTLYKMNVAAGVINPRVKDWQLMEIP